MRTIALLLFIVFEIAVLVMMDGFGQSFLISVAIGVFAVIAVVLFVTSDFFLDYQERRRERGRQE